MCQLYKTPKRTLYKEFDQIQKTVREETAVAVAKRAPKPVKILFKRFAEFAVEVQHRIWELHIEATTSSRFVPIFLNTWKRGPDGAPVECLEEERKYLSKIPAPTALHICNEARVVGLKRYSLSFTIPSQKCPIYIDPLRDTVYLSGEVPFDSDDDNNPQFAIQKLAFPILSVRIPSPTNDDLDLAFIPLLDILRKFDQLKKLYFVIHGGVCKSYPEKNCWPVKERLCITKYEEEIPGIYKKNRSVARSIGTDAPGGGNSRGDESHAVDRR